MSVGRPVRFNLGREPEDGSMYRASTNFANAAAGQGGAGIDVVLRSGDVALFRGHAVFHAVDGFADEGVEYGSSRNMDRPESADEKDDESATGKQMRKMPDGWADSLVACSGAETPRDGWRPARLALLFRDEEDAR